MSRGFFVVLEGSEGAGKTTLTRALAERMRQDGIEPVLVREPGGTPLAEALRSALLDPDHLWSPGIELLYMTAARADLVARVIRPAIEAGRTVVSDRYDLSTLAYQGAGRGLPLEQVQWVNAAATGGLAPDLTLVLDVDAPTGMERKRSAGAAADRMEREPEAFHRRVAAAYLAAVGPGVHHLDAAASPDRVLAAAWQQLVAARPDTFRPRSE
jgi:dTMP kinase